MRFQQTDYSCGAAAVINVALCFGKRLPERSVRAIAETTPEQGTDEAGIIKALAIFNLVGVAFEETDLDVAVGRLQTQIYNREPAIICTQQLQHWIAVIGAVADRFIIIDSSRTKVNLRENGVRVLTIKELKKTWRARGDRYFGILIRPKWKRRHV